MPAKDDFSTHTPSQQSPISRVISVTPDDGQDISHLSRALYLGTGGDLRATMSDGATVTFVNMAPGWHPIRVARVWSTGTTADHILGGW